MKLKKLFVLALALCIMTMVVPGAFAAGLTLDYGTSGIPVVEEPTRVVYNNVMNSRSSAGPITTTGKGLTLTKGVSETTTDGVYQIDLTAKSDSVIVSKGKPCDIILVLDGSGSMGENNDANFGKLKKAILGNNEDATSGFLKTVFDNSKESRVAIVRYSSDATVLTGTKQATSGAFVSISNATGTAVNSDLITAVTTGAAPDTANDSAYSNKGLAAATSIFHDVTEADEVNYDNERTVILFTDGVPGEGAWEGLFGSVSNFANGPAENSAMDSIHWSTILKGPKDKDNPVSVDTSQHFVLASGNDFNSQNRTQEGCGATIYTVAVFPNSGIYTKDFYHSQACAINEYMYRVSSDCPTGAHVPGWNFAYTNARTRNLSDGHYLVENNGNLSNIFHQIATETGVQATVVVRDYIPDYMQICDSSGIPVTSATYTLADSSEVKIAADSTGTYIEWPEVELKPKTSEFASYFNVKFVDGFMGGDSIPTNLAASGVFNGGESAYVAFGVPTVDVALKYSISHENAMVYLSNSFDQDNLFDEGTVDGVKNRFVTLVYTSTNGDTCTVEAGGTLSSSWLSSVTPNNCSDYTLSCTITSVNNSENTDEATATATVHVLKPTVTTGETTTYISNTVQMPADTEADKTVYDDKVVEWKDTTEGHAPAGVNVLPSVPDNTKLTWKFYDGETEVSSYTATNKACKELTAVLSINGNDYNKAFQNTYTVHVLTPNLAAASTEIYLGGDTNLYKQVGWMEGNSWNSCTTHSSKTTTDVPEGTAVPVANSASNCSFVNVSNPRNYTDITCKELTATWTSGDYSTSAKFDVHVLWPTINVTDDTIYLGDTSTLKASISQWTCDKHTGVTKETPTTGDFKFYDADDNRVTNLTVAPHDCARYTAKLDLGVGAYENLQKSFWVHVLTASVTVDDQVMYLSDSVTDKDATIEWQTKCDQHRSTVASGTKQKPNTVVFSKDGETTSIDACGEYTAYLKVGDTVYSEYKDDFQVHVLEPQIQANSFAMYLSNYVNLNDRQYITEWKCADKTETQLTKGRVKPPVAYDFYLVTNGVAATTAEENTDTYSPDDDVTLAVVVKINGNEYQKQYTGTFTIDVLKPIFSVNQKEVWADYLSKVDVYRQYGNTLKSVAWDKTAHTIVGGEPINITCTFELEKIAGDGAWVTENNVTSYQTGTDEDTFKVVKAVWAYGNGKTFTATGNRVNCNEQYDFVIHTNKFVLTINTDWSASDGEQQNAIFIVTPKTPDKNVKSFKVVVPADADSVIVKGLFCGQEYIIAEDNAWTWRYANSATEKYSEGKTCIACAGGLSPVDLAGTDRVTMSYVDTDYNAKWLAGEDCVINKINPQTQNAVVIPADRKKDEEVNA